MAKLNAVKVIKLQLFIINHNSKGLTRKYKK